MKTRFTSRIQMPAKPYRPSFDTDIAATIKAERKRLAAAEVCKVVRVAPLEADRVDVAPNFRRIK